MTEVNEKELYEQYGKAMISLEIAQQRVNKLKQQIADIINKGVAGKQPPANIIKKEINKEDK